MTTIFDVNTSPDAGTDRRVLRNPATLRLVAALAVSLVAVGALTGKTLGLWLGGAALSLFLAWWPRVIVDGQGMTVINLLPRRLAWKDIADVQWRRRWDRAGLLLVLANGKHRWAWGVLTDGVGDGADWTENAYRDVEARWRAALNRSD